MKLKTIENNNETIYKCYISSINDLLTSIETRPINDQIFDINDLRSEKPGPSYLNKTKSLQEAISLCRYGVSNEELEDFLNLNKYMENILPNFLQKRNIVNNLYGFRPDIYKVLNGNPNSMYQLKRKTPKKIMNILMLPSFYGLSMSKQIISLGVCIIQLVKLFEMAGYATELYYLDISRQWDEENTNVLDRDEEYLLYEILIKDSNQKINPVISYFPMCHQDFIRRIIFKLIETLPFKLEEWSSQYGSTVANYDEYLKYFDSYNICDKKILIDEQIVKNINGNNILNDFNKVLDIINFEQYLNDDQKKDYQYKMKKLRKRG